MARNPAWKARKEASTDFSSAHSTYLADRVGQDVPRQGGGGRVVRVMKGAEGATCMCACVCECV